MMRTHLKAKQVKRKRTQHCFHNLILWMVVWMMLSTFSVALATDTPNRLIDNAEILSELQKDTMQKELADLNEIAMIVVINDVGNKCTEEYAYSLAKEMYQDVFPSGTDGIVIFYCTSLEGYKVGVYYQGNFPVNTKSLQKEIVNEYKLYATDSAWIEGSINNVVKSLNAIIQKEMAPTVAPTQEGKAEQKEDNTKHSFWETFGIYQMIASIVAAVFFAGMIVAIHFYRKHRKQIDKDIDYWLK